MTTFPTPMPEIKLPTYQEVIDHTVFKDKGRWVTAAVTAFGWPLKITPVPFRNRTIVLIPPCQTRDVHANRAYPSAALKLLQQEAIEEGQRIISHFLSSLAWVDDSPIEEKDWTVGGVHPHVTFGFNGTLSINEHFRVSYLPDPADPQARLALGFYREGLFLNHVGYQCLSFFKILNIMQLDPKKQIAWINANVDKVKTNAAKKRLATLRTTELDIGHFLYGSNRCAVAHAGGSPTADPEDPYDRARLRSDLPLVRALAALAIESHFNVKSSMTVYRERLCL